MSEGDLGFSSLSQIRLSAEIYHLDYLLDAYQTFCSEPTSALSWSSLALQLGWAIQSQSREDAPEDSCLASRPASSSEHPCVLYIRELPLKQFAYHTSDMITALFHVTKVLPLPYHFDSDIETSALKVVPWILTPSTPYTDFQRAVRTYLQSQPLGNLHVMLTAIKDELFARSKSMDNHSANLRPWEPCWHSHPAVLLQLAPCRDVHHR